MISLAAHSVPSPPLIFPSDKPLVPHPPHLPLFYSSRAAQVRAATSLHHHDETYWCITRAPSPDEILWGNLGIRAWQRGLRFSLLWMLYLGLLFVFVIPIVAVQGLINLEALVEWSGGLKALTSTPFVYEIIQASSHRTPPPRQRFEILQISQLVGI